MYKSILHLFAIFLFTTANLLHASETPKSLEEWKPWVLEKHPEMNCPILFNDNIRTCAWNSELRIAATNTGATFTLRTETFSEQWISLPGNSTFWPQQINLNNNKINVRDNEGIAEILLPAGNHIISGEFHWKELPRTLQVPQQTGIIQLSLNGKPVAAPSIENGNELWLSANETQTATAHQDTMNVRVFRKLSDNIPLQLTTQLQLDVSGKERELELGPFLLSGFTTTEFTSELPARIEKNGNLRVQVKPGSWVITLNSQSATPLHNLTFTPTSELWPQQEIWTFEANRQLRSVQISGVQTIDPQQTQLPEEWKQLPAYLMTPDTHFIIEELQRGANQQANNELTLEKKTWLSFDGESFIHQDQISGTAHNSRLETINPYELTNAIIASKPQLITHLNGSKNTGVEIRTHQVDVLAVSHLARSLTLPVSGWNTDFTKVNMQLYMPPGWSLITATGTSSEHGTWISKWTLWDMFLIFIIAAAIGRITTPLYGVLAAVTLLLIFQRTDAPIFIWLNIIAAIALIPFVSGKFKKYIINYTYLSFIFLALTLLPFAVREARAVINPQLESISIYDSLPFASSSSNYSDNTYQEIAPAPVAVLETKVVEEAEPNDEVVVTGISNALTKSSSVRREISNDYDPNQQTQTGIALPTWDNNSVYLQWSGSINADEKSRFIFINPLINRIGYFLSLLLPLLLASILLRQFFIATGKSFTLPAIKNASPLALLPLILITGLWLAPNQPAQADVNIDPAILKELEDRLTRAPNCLPNCAAIESINITINNDQLIIDAQIHSSDLIALPLPADHEQWWPNQVTVDGKNATLVQTDNNILLLSLSKGRHSVVITSSLQGRDTLNLEFPVALHNLTSTTNGWELSGAPSADQTSQSLQLQRVERDANANKSEHLRPEPVAPFVIVRRELQLNIDWAVTTTVTRVAPALGAINIEVPLIEGELPLTAPVNSNGKISVHFEANQQSVEWRSNVKQITPLILKAAENMPWVEVWALNASPLWHTETKGIAPIQFSNKDTLPLWQPWPNETLTIDITKPSATKGSYITVDSAELSNKFANRSNTSHLFLSIRSNQGGQYNFTLPKDVSLTQVSIDGNILPISAINGAIKIPLHPGTQNIFISWKDEKGISFFSKTPTFSLEQGSSNQQINIRYSENRWLLFVGGPMMGPSILIWGMLIVVLLISIALGRSGLTPLAPYQWILLSMGICTLSFSAFIVVALWLIVLQQRGKLHSISSSRQFKWMQFGLFVFSAIALTCLIGTIPAGLLGSPNMHIVGDASYGNLLHWYQDHSDAAFPTAWIISLPLWCYKVAILLWAFWLSSALLGWIRWAWQQLSHQALWYAPIDIITKATTESGDATTTNN